MYSPKQTREAILSLRSPKKKKKQQKEKDAKKKES
jgi:hypothetical protein